MKIKQKIIAKLDNKYGEKRWYISLKTDYVYRTLVTSALGTIVTVGFALYNGLLGIFNSSIWHGVFSAYLIVLAIHRLLVLLGYRLVSKKYGEDSERIERAKLKIYLANGAVFVPIAIALSVIISLLINSQKPVVSDEILAIATAAYAFCKITMAIVNFKKSKTIKDPIAQTIRNTCFIDAIVSIILLESTLITTFGELTYKMYMLIAVSGLVGCCLALALGTYMIINGAKKLRISRTI